LVWLIKIVFATNQYLLFQMSEKSSDKGKKAETVAGYNQIYKKYFK